MYKIHLIGSEYHCNMVKGILKDEKEILFEETLSQADLLYVVYGPGVNRKTLKYWLFSNKPILIHWIGTDSFIFDNTKKRPSLIAKMHKLVSILLINYRKKKNTLKFVSSAPWLAKSVEEMSKIRTDYFVLTSIENEELLEPNGTREYDFISYIPIQSFDMYFGYDYLNIVKANPTRKFCIVCPDLLKSEDWPYERYPNLLVQHRTSKIQFYKLLNNSKCFVRMKDGGDAIALSVLEALAHGCDVVWNLKFDYCNYETRDSFKINYKNYIVDGFKMNKKAINFVKQNYNVETWKSQFKVILKEFL